MLILLTSQLCSQKKNTLLCYYNCMQKNENKNVVLREPTERKVIPIAHSIYYNKYSIQSKQPINLSDCTRANNSNKTMMYRQLYKVKIK